MNEFFKRLRRKIGDDARVCSSRMGGINEQMRAEDLIQTGDSLRVHLVDSIFTRLSRALNDFE